jgi:peroxiredoxin
LFRWLAFVTAAATLFLLIPSWTAAEKDGAKTQPVDFLSRMLLGIQPLEGKKAQDFALPTLDGKIVRFSDLKGKVVLLTFWASWCPACRLEMPKLEEVHRRYKDRDLAVLTVAIDTRGKKSVYPFAKGFGFTFPILLDPKNDIMDRYRVNLIPTTFVVGRDGELLGKAIGPKNWKSGNAERFFEGLLQTAQTSPPLDVRAQAKK